MQKGLFLSGDILVAYRDVCVRAVHACGLRWCGVDARRESGHQNGCGEVVPGDAGGRCALVGSPPCIDTDTCRHCAGEHVGSWSTQCLPAVLGRACVGAWAGEGPGGSFGAFAQVAVWSIARLLKWGASTLLKGS